MSPRETVRSESPYNCGHQMESHHGMIHYINYREKKLFIRNIYPIEPVFLY
jgi:hypothetical protein